MKRHFAVIWGLLLVTMSMNVAYGQSGILDVSASAVSVKGSSTLHNWVAKASDFGVKPLNIAIAEGAEIDSLYFFVAVKSMDGGRGATMNGKIQKAFNEPENPLIEYIQTEPSVIAKGENGLSLQSTGQLKMAGKTKNIQLMVNGEPKDGGILFKSEHALKMTDFEIEPPTAMFGQIVCEDEVTVVFELFFKSK